MNEPVTPGFVGKKGMTASTAPVGPSNKIRCYLHHAGEPDRIRTQAKTNRSVPRALAGEGRGTALFPGKLMLSTDADNHVLR